MQFSRSVKIDSLKDEIFVKPLEIIVNNNFEDAYRRFKTLVQNDGIIADYKAKQIYEKPSEKKRRKCREAQERRLLLANREALILSGEWDKRQKRKEQKRQEKVTERRNRQNSE